MIGGRVTWLCMQKYSHVGLIVDCSINLIGMKRKKLGMCHLDSLQPCMWINVPNHPYIVHSTRSRWWWTAFKPYEWWQPLGPWCLVYQMSVWQVPMVVNVHSNDCVRGIASSLPQWNGLAIMCVWLRRSLYNPTAKRRQWTETDFTVWAKSNDISGEW